MNFSTVDICLYHINKGNVLLYPTDTIWGIGCDSFNEHAIRKIYEIKNRPEDKPFVHLVSSIAMLKEFINEIHPKIETLIQYHNRPLTVIYPRADKFPSIAKSKNGSIAIRVCKEGFAHELINQLGKPIVATSANISNEPFPQKYREITQNILDKIDFCVPPESKNEEIQTSPSTIIKLSKRDEIVFLRE